MNDYATITVTVQPPYHGKPITVKVQMSHRIWGETFTPLPRNREIPWEFREQAEATHMVHQRRVWSERLARQLAHHIIECAEKQDPQFGYSPEEWAEINQTKPNDPAGH